MALTSFDRFNKIMKITRLMATICGADVTRPDYKMSIITWTVITAINLYFACTIYTMYVGVVIDKDWKVILQSLCLTGTAIQVSTVNNKEERKERFNFFFFVLGLQ